MSVSRSSIWSEQLNSRLKACRGMSWRRKVRSNPVGLDAQRWPGESWRMAQFVQIGSSPAASVNSCETSPRASGSVIWLQVITLAWMLVECGVSLYSARKASSPALLAFGSDSFVELLSAAVVLLQFTPKFSISKTQAARIAGILLFVLATVVAITAAASLVLKLQPETSLPGMLITAAALVAMPVLASRKRAVARRTNNRALAADAVQSATCAYLAGITLAGLGINAVFHLPWVDSIAAFAAIPILIVEGRRALKGESCGCC
jgi:divalent metal cation (Fe/Co/Zn/Cd) transporter